MPSITNASLIIDGMFILDIVYVLLYLFFSFYALQLFFRRLRYDYLAVYGSIPFAVTFVIQLVLNLIFNKSLLDLSDSSSFPENICILLFKETGIGQKLNVTQTAKNVFSSSKSRHPAVTEHNGKSYV